MQEKKNEKDLDNIKLFPVNNSLPRPTTVCATPKCGEIIELSKTYTYNRPRYCFECKKEKQEILRKARVAKRKQNGV